MGSVVDRLACVARNTAEIGTSSENKSFSRHACAVEKESDGEEPDENA